MAVRNYSELCVWQKAMDLVEEVYKATKRFPKEELYGLTGQIRRAAVSVPSNIAEGQGRKSLKEFLHHLSLELTRAEYQQQSTMRRSMMKSTLSRLRVGMRCCAAV
ncbi:MAG: four helix bundle protein [Pyrinomonadaceae bacterium]|nr:four helix bundle protein [Pyrinomonadaceae bacterium]